MGDEENKSGKRKKHKNLSNSTIIIRILVFRFEIQ